MSDILYEKKGPVGIITFNRPKSLNAMNIVMWDGVETYIREAGDDPDVRAIIITGTGRAFSAGADLSQGFQGGGKMSGGMTVMMKKSLGRLHRSLFAITGVEKPVIAAVNGLAYGATLNLALCCDLVIAAQSAVFCQVFNKRGIVPDLGGMYILPRLIGPQKAKELFFFGSKITAEEGMKLGFVNKVVPDDKIMDEALEWANKLAEGPTIAYGLTKAIVNKGLELDMRTVLEMETQAQAYLMSTEDAKEGMMSFIQKRDPKFKGR